MLLSCRGARWIAAGVGGFLAENLVLSENRTWIIENIPNGAAGYHSLYNALSSAACASVAWGYFKHGRGQGPRVLAAVGGARLASSFVLRAGALAGLSQFLPKLQIPVELADSASVTGAVSTGPSTREGVPPVTPAPKNEVKVRCPIDFRPKDVPEDGIYGVFRISRYPMLWFGSLYALSAALLAPFAAEVVMFSSPLLVTAVLTEHMDHRFRRGIGGKLDPERDMATSNVPFGAFVRGQQSLAQLATEFKWVNLSLAVALAACVHVVRVRRLPLQGIAVKHW